MNQLWSDNQKLVIAGAPFVVSAPFYAIYGTNPQLWILIVALLLTAIHLVLGFRFFFSSFIQIFIRALLSALVVFAFTYAIIEIIQSTDYIVWFYLGIVLFTWSIIIVVLSRYNIRLIKSLKHRGLITFTTWTAFITGRDQGTDSKELILDGDNIKQLSFRVKPKSGYWRAGFKLCDANQSDLPLRSQDSLLFHVGGEQPGGFIGVSGYINGYEKEIHKPLGFKNDGGSIDVNFEINDKNWFKCIVNGSTQFEDRVNPKILKKAYLLAWGDGINFEVDFENISYQKR